MDYPTIVRIQNDIREGRFDDPRTAGVRFVRQRVDLEYVPDWNRGSTVVEANCLICVFLANTYPPS
jgi:hypothetical protein